MSQPEDTEGNLTIKVLEAKLTRNTDLFSQMDPYVVLEINGMSAKSSIKVGAGKYPKWNETYSLRCKVGQTLNYSIWDQDYLSKDDLVGGGSIDINDYYIQNSSAIWAPIIFNKMNCGDLGLELCFYPDFDPNEKKYKELLAVKTNKLLEFDDLKAILRGEKPKAREETKEEVVNLDELRKKNDETRAKVAEHVEEIKNLSKKIEDQKSEITLVGESTKNEIALNDGRKKELKYLSNSGQPGIITVSNIGIKLISDKEGLGKIDPYVIVHCGTQIFKTAVKNGAGNTTFSEVFQINRQQNEQIINIFIMDKETLSSRIVATSSFAINQLIVNPEIKGYITTCHYLDNMNGNVVFDINFAPK